MPSYTYRQTGRGFLAHGRCPLRVRECGIISIIHRLLHGGVRTPPGSPHCSSSTRVPTNTLTTRTILLFGEWCVDGCSVLEVSQNSAPCEDAMMDHVICDNSSHFIPRLRFEMHRQTTLVHKRYCPGCETKALAHAVICEKKTCTMLAPADLDAAR